MSVETHRVLMGACGWKHQAWLNDFYSEDLPEEWQLGFYSNEFPVVCVPAADWLDSSNTDESGMDIAEWRNDVSDSFRFILEVPEYVLNNEHYFVTVLEKVKTLGELCLALVFKFTADMPDDALLFQKQLEMAKAIAPVCINKGEISLPAEVENILQQQNVSAVWDGKAPYNEYYKCGPVSICQVSGDGLDIKGLRQVVENCLSASNENCISVLCLDGSPPSLEKLRNTEIILNLL